MKKIEELEQIKNGHLELTDTEINRTFYWAYIASHRANNKKN